jgi:hypothetical protein
MNAAAVDEAAHRLTRGEERWAGPRSSCQSLPPGGAARNRSSSRSGNSRSARRRRMPAGLCRAGTSRGGAMLEIDEPPLSPLGRAWVARPRPLSSAFRSAESTPGHAPVHKLALIRVPTREARAASCDDLAPDSLSFSGLTVSRTTSARRRPRCSPQPADRSRLSPLGDVSVEPRHGVLAELPPLWKLASQLEAVDGRTRQPGELRHLSDPKKFHVGASCYSSLPRSAVASRSLAPTSREVITGYRGFLAGDLKRSMQHHPTELDWEVARGSSSWVVS